MDRFFQIVIYGTLIGLITGCVGCSMFGSEKMTDKEFLKALKDAGCELKAVSRDTDRKDPAIDNATCQELVRYGT